MPGSVELTRQLPRLHGVLICAMLLLPIAWTTSVRGEAPDNSLPGELDGLGVTEHLSEAIPPGVPFRDEAGRPVTLGQFFSSGKPVIVSFNYSNCPMLCSLQLTGLVAGLKEVDLTCGTDYEFVSISIDPNELPARAAQTRQRYYQSYGRQGTGNGWHFLVGSEKSIAAVASAVGVNFKYLPARKEYVHPAVCVVATPDGTLSRYLYGVEFDRQTLRLSLVEAGEGKIGTTLDQILLFCFHYDSGSGKYSLAARRIMSSAGLFTATLLGLFLSRQFRREAIARTARLTRTGNSA